MVNYKKILLVSFSITILVFLAGLLLGLSLDDTKVSDLINNLNQNELNRESYLVEQEFMQTVGGNLCDLSSPRIQGLSNELANLGQLLTSYEKTSLLRNSEYIYLKTKYFLLEIRTFALFTNLKKECDYDLNTMLYFYDQGEQESLNQGYIIDSLVESHDNLHIFSFDRNFEEPTLDALKLHYNITKSPAIIINNEIKKEGLTDLNELKEILNYD